MNTFILRFCWTLKLPQQLTYKGKIITLEAKTIKLKAENRKILLDNLKGTDPKIIAALKEITNGNNNSR